MTADYNDYMFYVPIYHYAVRDWENKKTSLMELYNRIDRNLERKDDDSVITNYHKDSLSMIESISEIFTDEINLFCGKVQSRFKLACAWFELTDKHAYHSMHNHGCTGYSSVCYIKYNSDEHKPTHFMSPFPNFLTGLQLTYTPEVDEGSIIFFPSYISHFTEPNLSDENRLIVSFNLQSV